MRKVTDDKLVCLFDVVSVVQAEVEKLKKHPVMDKAWSGAGGVVGGFVAYLASKLWG